MLVHTQFPHTNTSVSLQRGTARYGHRDRCALNTCECGNDQVALALCRLPPARGYAARNTCIPQHVQEDFVGFYPAVGIEQ